MTDGNRDTSRGRQRAGGSRSRGPGEDPHICTACDSHLVQPVEWVPVDRRRWRVELYCPECGHQTAVVFPQRVLDRFDRILDDGTASLTEDLAELERGKVGDVDRFRRALSGKRPPSDLC
jgi:predicted RNA-binding Zn-ribbon protein involved in translation (DUF1610 family)